MKILLIILTYKFYLIYCPHSPPYCYYEEKENKGIFVEYFKNHFEKLNHYNKINFTFNKKKDFDFYIDFNFDKNLLAKYDNFAKIKVNLKFIQKNKNIYFQSIIPFIFSGLLILIIIIIFGNLIYLFENQFNYEIKKNYKKSILGSIIFSIEILFSKYNINLKSSLSKILMIFTILILLNFVKHMIIEILENTFSYKNRINIFKELLDLKKTLIIGDYLKNNKIKNYIFDHSKDINEIEKYFKNSNYNNMIIEEKLLSFLDFSIRDYKYDNVNYLNGYINILKKKNSKFFFNNFLFEIINNNFNFIEIEKKNIISNINLYNELFGLVIYFLLCVIVVIIFYRIVIRRREIPLNEINFYMNPMIELQIIKYNQKNIYNTEFYEAISNILKIYNSKHKSKLEIFLKSINSLNSKMSEEIENKLIKNE